MVQFSGLRYLFCTSASLSLSKGKLVTISAKFESKTGALFSTTLNSSTSQESPLDHSPRSEGVGCIKLSIFVATALSVLAFGFL